MAPRRGAEHWALWSNDAHSVPGIVCPDTLLSLQYRDLVVLHLADESHPSVVWYLALTPLKCPREKRGALGECHTHLMDEETEAKEIQQMAHIPITETALESGFREPVFFPLWGF